MNILIITDYSKISLGGDSRVPWELARHVASNTNNNVYVLTSGDNFDIKEDEKVPDLKIVTVPSNYIMYSLGIFKMSATNIYKLMKFLNPLDIDVVHSHTYSPLAFTVQSWAIERNIPFVYTAHVLPSKALGFQKGVDLEDDFKILMLPIMAYLKTYHKGCTSIVALNEYAKDDCDPYTKGKIKTEIIPNGSAFKISKDTCDTTPPTKSDENILSFFGHITGRKNQSYLVRSLRYIKNKKDLKLILPGGVMEEDENERLLEEKTTIQNAEVVLPGFISHEKIWELLKKSHYLVSASVMEVQSLTVIEALASGTPVIALENETTKELIKDGYNGFLLKADATEKEFGKTVEKALSIDSKKYLEMCKNSRESVKHLTWGNVWKKTEKLYKELISDMGEKRLPNEKNIVKRVTESFKLKDLEKRDNRKKAKYISLGLISIVVAFAIGIYKASTLMDKKKEEKKKTNPLL